MTDQGESDSRQSVWQHLALERQLDDLWIIVERLTKERDEALAEVERLRGEIEWLHDGIRQQDQRLALYGEPQ